MREPTIYNNQQRRVVLIQTSWLSAAIVWCCSAVTNWMLLTIVIAEGFNFARNSEYKCMIDQHSTTYIPACETLVVVPFGGPCPLFFSSLRAVQSVATGVLAMRLRRRLLPVPTRVWMGGSSTMRNQTLFGRGSSNQSLSTRELLLLPSSLYIHSALTSSWSGTPSLADLEGRQTSVSADPKVKF